MKVLNFSCVEILPSLLDKTKTQTIRPAWKEVIIVGRGMGKSGSTFFGLRGNDSSTIIEKPPRFKVGEEVKLMWNQRSKYQWFCRECGGGIDGYVTAFEGVNVFRHNGLHECIMKNQVNDFLDLVFSDNSVFNKTLGTAEIIEVKKITMWRHSIGKKDFFCRDEKGYTIYVSKVKELAKRVGFTSSEAMFDFFHKNYDLNERREFWIYEWKWLKEVKNGT